MIRVSAIVLMLDMPMTRLGGVLSLVPALMQKLVFFVFNIARVVGVLAVTGFAMFVQEVWDEL